MLMKIHDEFIDKLDFAKRNGLIPVVVQDIKTKDILMLAYANRTAIEKTVKTGNAWFWSVSRNKLWMKGEESGNIQDVKDILVDCDLDSVVYLVDSKILHVIQEIEHVSTIDYTLSKIDKLFFKSCNNYIVYSE